jgi:hypothetical protein
LESDIPVADADIGKPFATLNSWMQLCFARESWDFIGSQLEMRWMALGQTVAQTADGARQLLCSAYHRRVPGTAKSWVPLSHPLQITQTLYGAEPMCFLSLTSQLSEGADHLAILAETHGRLIPEIHKSMEISPAFLMAFRNFMAAQRTFEELRGFDFARYSALFSQFDTDVGARWFWRPGDRALGPEHYGAALGRLIDRLHEAGLEQEGANNQRINAAMSLCNTASLQGEKSPPLPRAIETSHALIELAPAFISGFARASRRGSAADYLNRLAGRLQRPYRRVIGDAAFLIRLGPELLAFFLLLWELESERALVR